MATSDSDLLSHFTPLDELIQLIYQGSHKFVVLSSVDEVSWTVHLGLNGSEGRWWSGRWTEKDIRQFVGHNSSAVLLESFAEKLATTFIQGELYVGNWNTEKGADVNLTLGPTAKTPIHIPLTELSPEEAAAFAAKVFTEIALQAQSRKSHLHPPAYQPNEITSIATHTVSAPTHTPTKHKRKASNSEPEASSSTLPKKPSTAELKAQTKIKELEAELAQEKKKKSGVAAKSNSDGLASRAKTSSAARPLKGASLANPNKKARKYQALEFGSDED